jgi:hypothetical protein
MSDQGSTMPPPDDSSSQSGGFGAGGYGAGGGYGAPPPSQPYGGFPPGGGGGPGGPPPPNHLVWAILSTLFCCLPLGIVSIVFAAQVNSKHAVGDMAGALDSSRKAKNFAIWSAVATLVGVVVSIIFFIVLAAAGSMSAG